MRNFVHLAISAILPLFFFVGFMLFASGCASWNGGGQDSITIHMPFTFGYSALCTQGINDSYSHNIACTRYDIDFDTPNYSDDYVYAPISGTAYVHDSDRDTGFGVHVNIDLGDGTYIILAHLDDVFVENGAEVAQGQLIATEGDTGNSFGDHLHIGRHEGDPQSDGQDGASIEGLQFEVIVGSGVTTLSVADFDCDLYEGAYYGSALETVAWHPDGTLIKTPLESEVYIIKDGYKRHFANEEVFWSYNYDFTQLAYVDDFELSCYPTGSEYTDVVPMDAVYVDGVVWLLVGDQDGEDWARYRVPSSHWQEILKSWGINASSYDDLSENEDILEDYERMYNYAMFREGTLVKESSSSDVYAIVGDIAYPIEDWETYLIMGFYERDIIVVDDGVVEDVMGSVGDCSYDIGCISYDDLFSCAMYGQDEDSDDFESATVDEDEDEDEAVEDEDEESTDDDFSIPDDLNESLDWIRVYNNAIGLRVGEVFSASVNGDEVAITGVGIDGSWGYSRANLTDYYEDTDMAWYELASGSYRITMRTQDEWAMYYEFCLSSSDTSQLCHENQDGTFALCMRVRSGVIEAMSDSDCASME